MSFIVWQALQELSYRKDFDLSDKFRMHPSSITSCPRAQVARAAGIAPDTSVKNELMFCIANNAHNMIEQLLGISMDGVHSDSEVSLEDRSYMLKGRADIILSGPKVYEVEKTDRLLIDIKTKAFVNKKDEAYDRDISQVQLYMHMSGIEKATLLYVSRVNGAYAIHDVDYSKSWVDSLLQKIDDILDILDSGNIPGPDRDCNKCWHMNFCESEFLDTMEDIILKSYEASKTDECVNRRSQK